MSDHSLAVGILTYNGRAFVQACLASVSAQTLPPVEVVVVDNASTDDTTARVAAHHPPPRLIRNAENVGVALGLNQLVAATTAPVVVLLNQDVELRPGALEAITAAFADPQVGVVGIKLLFPDGRTIQHAGGWLEWPLFLAQHYGYGEPDDGRWDTPRDVEFVTGAVFAVRRAAWDALGGMADAFSPAYFEETDFCLRARAGGWKVLYTPAAVAIHHESTTLGRGSRRYLDLYHRHRLRLALRHTPLDDLLRHFARAEAWRTVGLRRIAGDARAADEVDALAAAYADAAVQWPTLAATRGDAPLSGGALWAVADMLTALHFAATASRDADDWQRLVLPSPRLLRTRDLIVATEGSLRMAATPTAIAAAAAAQTVTEQPFRSDTPLIGPHLARARDAFNSISTRWYVRPLLEQQNRFNAATITALRTLEESVANFDPARLAASLREVVTAADSLETAQAALRFDLDRLAARVAALEAGDRPPTTGDGTLTTAD